MQQITVKAGSTKRLPFDIDEIRPIYFGVECHDSKDLDVNVWFKEKLDDESPASGYTPEKMVVLANRRLDEVIRETFHPPTLGVLTIE